MQGVAVPPASDAPAGGVREPFETEHIAIADEHPVAQFRHGLLPDAEHRDIDGHCVER